MARNFTLNKFAKGFFSTQQIKIGGIGFEFPEDVLFGRVGHLIAHQEVKLL